MIEVQAAPSPEILAWQDDPGASQPPLVPPDVCPVPNLTLAPLALNIPTDSIPDPNQYPLNSPSFRYWTAAESARVVPLFGIKSFRRTIAGSPDLYLA